MKISQEEEGINESESPEMVFQDMEPSGGEATLSKDKMQDRIKHQHNLIEEDKAKIEMLQEEVFFISHTREERRLKVEK